LKSDAGKASSNKDDSIEESFTHAGDSTETTPEMQAGNENENGASRFLDKLESSSNLRETSLTADYQHVAIRRSESSCLHHRLARPGSGGHRAAVSPELAVVIAERRAFALCIFR
jgi:hypothetical protein